MNIVLQRYKHERSQNSRYQGFSYLFYLMMEGSGPRSGYVQIMIDPDPGGQKRTDSDPLDPFVFGPPWISDPGSGS